MRQFTLLGLILLCGLALGQDAEANVEASADGDVNRLGVAAGAEGEGEAGEECEEAWDYVEFMKASLKDKIESILQDTLFQPRPLLEETVTKTMESVLEIRDDILTRTKAIRTGDESITICHGQNIKQEEFLTQIRMQIMSVLLSLIEKEAASTEKLQDIGKQLLAIRTKVNSEITRMIMLRESTGTVRIKSDDCDCGILGEVLQSLDEVVNAGDEKKDGDAEVIDEGDEPTQGDNPAGKAAGEGGEDNIQALTMISMTVDAEIKTLYNQILSELDDEARAKIFEELQNLKTISTDIHEILSKLAGLDPELDAEAISRVNRRDVRSVRNDVKRLYDICQLNCPGECDSCGAEKIDEISDKLKDYLANLEDLEEDEAKESIRTDLMAYLTQINTDMTELLRTKAEDGELDTCGTEQLEVIDKIKGPMWMMVNITIFGDASTMGEMITALEQALTEMRQQYCAADSEPAQVKIEEDECDLNEINQARDWIADIDVVIAEDIFKGEEDDHRRNAMLGLIELKSTMDNRVRELFQDNLQCKEEVEQIKNIYGQKLTECLAEMMNPRFRFDLLPRAERVQCVKDLRTLIEDRRGVLLMREIESKINESGVSAIGDFEQ